MAEPRDARYPFSLNTGRLRDQWHGMSRTGMLGRLFGHVSEPSLQMHPQDMARRQLKAGELVQVSSRRGALVVPVQPATDLGMSQLFLAMHWGDEFLGGSAPCGKSWGGVNALTLPANCPDSHQPELKAAAVKVSKAELPWSLLTVAWMSASEVLLARQALQALLPRFAFASCVPFASKAALGGPSERRSGVLLRAAAAQPVAEELIAQIETIVGLQGDSVLRYQDRKMGQRRAVKLVQSESGRALEAFLLAGDTSAQAWITTLLQDELPADAYGRLLLLPGAKPPVAVQTQGRQVCSCFNVSETAIEQHLARSSGPDGDRLVSLQQALQCGTNCGSCLPELKRLVRLQPQAQTA